MGKIMLNAASSGIAWKEATIYLKWQSQIMSLAITVLIILVIAIAYRIALRKLKPDRAPEGYLLLCETFIDAIRNLVIDILGKRFEKTTPYFVYLCLYIFIGIGVSLLGFESTISSYTIAFLLGAVTFVGIFVVGIRYQKWRFFKRYFFNVKIKNRSIPVMINPFNILGSITPLISISFRIWGNVLASTIIINMIFYGLGAIWEKIPGPVGLFNVPGALITPVFHMYFDGVSTVIQTFVFMLLTMMYWALEIEGDTEKVIRVDESDKKVLNLSK